MESGYIRHRRGAKYKRPLLRDPWAVRGRDVLVMSLLKVGIIATTVQTVIVLAVFVYISVVHSRASKIFW